MSDKTSAVVAFLVSAVVAACASGGTAVTTVPPAPTDVAPPASPPGPCLVVPNPDSPRDTAIVVVEVRERPWSIATAAVSAGADTVATAASRASDFVLAQLYQPLVRVTCDGRTVPELAERWSVDSNNRSVTFQVRTGARFVDGAEVTFDDVAASLGPRMPRTLFVVGIGGTAMGPAHTVTLAPNDSDGVGLFAFGQLERAVARKETRREWPTGSGPFLVDTVASRVNAGTTILRPAGRAPGPVLIVREDTARDQRDLMDRGVDILQTRDPVALDYARRGSFNIHPLPFDRTYVLAIPALANVDSANSASRRVPEMDAAPFRAALARDAVRIEARAAEMSYWWEGLSCGAPAGGTATRSAQGQTGPPRIMYDAKDPVARSLAERVVAIARTGSANPSDREARILAQLIPTLSAPGGRTLTAAPVDDNALRTGSAAAFIVAVPARVLARCASLLRLRQNAEWLSPSAIFPLIDTRSFLVTRSGAPGVVVDWDGTLRIQPALPVRRSPQR